MFFWRHKKSKTKKNYDYFYLPVSKKSSPTFSCCRTSGKSGEAIDGFRIIVLSMFVFSVGVTVALVIQIAAGSSLSQSGNWFYKVFYSCN
jgi:hypothetical protein